MKSSKIFFVGFSLLILLVCYGCGAGSYQEEMALAQQAMDEAKSIRTSDLAPADWEEAMQAWDEAQAAVQENKSSKTLFLRAKSRFEKAATIAQSRREALINEVGELQSTIDARYSELKAALTSGRLNRNVQKEVQTLTLDIDENASILASLIEQQDYVKARETAKEVQQQIYNAQLIMAGKKPAE